MTTSHAAPPTSNSAATRLLWIALLLTALAYAGTLRYEFVFDDQPQIVNNPLLRRWQSMPRIFTQHLWAQVAPEGKGIFYRPVFMLWLLVNFKAFRLAPLGWHASTIAMHLLVTFLVYRLSRRVLRNDTAAGIATLIFGLHPTHIETVSWISGVSDSLMAAPLLGSMLCWVNFRERDRGRWSWLAASLGLGIVALLAKETAVVLPGLVAAYEFWLVSRTRETGTRLRLAFATALPFLVLDVWYLAVRQVVLTGVAFAMTPVETKTLLLTWPSLLWFYVRHLLWPVGISAFYDTPYVRSAQWATFWLPLAAVAMCVAGLSLWVRRAHSGAVAFACVWMALPLLPALDLPVFQYGELAHDRYLYLPAFGFALLAAIAVGRLPATRVRLLGMPAPAGAVTLAIAVAFGAAIAIQNVQWASTLLLYSRAVQIAPNNPHAVRPLAMEFLRRDDFESAAPLLERAARLVPSEWSNYFLLGHAQYRLGRYGEAEKWLLRAIEVNPNSAAEFYFLGLSRIEAGKLAEAEQPLRKAIELLPTGRGFHQALGTVLAARGDLPAARAEYQVEMSNDPQNEGARRELAALEARIHSRRSSALGRSP